MLWRYKKAVRICIPEMLIRASKAVTLMDQDLEGATGRAGERHDSLPGPTTSQCGCFPPFKVLSSFPRHTSPPLLGGRSAPAPP